MEQKHIAAIVVSVIYALLIGVPNYSNHLTFFGQDRAVWLVLIPVIMVLTLVSFSRFTPILNKEVVFDKPEKVLNEFLTSREFLIFSPEAHTNELKPDSVFAFKRTGDYVFSIRFGTTNGIGGIRYILMCDGRKDTPTDQRAYTLLESEKLYEAGFSSVMDLYRKLSYVPNDMTMAQILYDMSPEERARVMSSGGMSSIPGGVKK